MGTKTSLTLGAFAILALLIAGVSYWAIRENPQSGPPGRNLAESSPPPALIPSAPKNSPPLEQEKQAADASPQTALSTTPAAPTTPSSPPTSASAAPEQSRQVKSEKPPSAAMASAMPDEDKMSETNRRQVQEALHGMGYYDGSVDGIFGPLTRTSIRRFQDSIGEEQTGRLTAAQAARLANATGLETGAGTGGLGIPEAPVGHRQPTQADLPPSVRQEVPAADNPPAVRNNARARGASKRDSGSTGNTGAGQIPSICTGC
jgi:peptidoglycan hydrolase-like protein with peptidoglycan-binding domain